MSELEFIELRNYQNSLQANFTKRRVIPKMSELEFLEFEN